MKTKQLIIATVALGVVVAIIAVSEKMGARAPATKTGDFIAGMSKEDIGAVVIADSKDTVKVRRKGDTWVVAPASIEGGEQGGGISAQKNEQAQTNGTYRADSASVQTMLEKIENFKPDELVSQNPEKKSVFEVDSAKGLYVALMDLKGKSLAAFRIGKSGPDWSSNYVRMVGSDKVYTVRGSIRHSFFTDRKRWRDKSVIAFDKSDVKTLSLAKKGSYTIKLEKSLDTANQVQWDIAAPEKSDADKKQVEEILQAMASLKASDFEESDTLSDSAMGFAEPELIATATLENGKTKVVTIGGENSGKFWVKSNEREPVFLVSDFSIKNIDKNLEELKKKDVEAGEESES
jgi:hypothetical protein